MKTIKKSFGHGPHDDANDVSQAGHSKMVALATFVDANGLAA